MKKRINSLLSVGDRVYEVFIYKVRPAKITSVERIRLDDPARTRTVVYTVGCDDGSVSPRYYESDIGRVIFTDLNAARIKCGENRAFRSLIGSRGLFKPIKDAPTLEERYLKEDGFFAAAGRKSAKRAKERAALLWS